MIKISCYLTTQGQLPKTFCQLAEKCYYTNLKTTVFTENEDYSNSLDRVLWTYSKKHFIPHATDKDPFPEKQPLLITNNAEKYNQSEIIFFVNAIQDTILKIIAKDSKIQLNNTQNIIFLFDEFQKIQSNEITSIMQKSYINDFIINSFSQNEKGIWDKV